jgi:dUTPase
MPVLSDGTIRGEIQAGRLITGGDLTQAVHCCYEFSADVLFRGAGKRPEPASPDGLTIGPAELVWVRAKEKIAVPADRVGVWMQTQTLSRQGLLLLNTSLIEPGYEGPLTAVFVNFGARHVVINPTTKIAKVLFLTLDQQALVTVPSGHQPDYDAAILQTSANAPGTFLQIEQMLPRLERETETRLGQIDAQLRAAQALSEERLKLAERALLERSRESLLAEVAGHGRRWLGGLALGFVVACLAVWFAVGAVLPQLVTHYANIDSAVARAVQIGNAPILEQLRGDLRSSRSELDSVKQQLGEMREAIAAIAKRERVEQSPQRTK